LPPKFYPAVVHLSIYLRQTAHNQQAINPKKKAERNPVSEPPRHLKTKWRILHAIDKATIWTQL
jgi:hypothetical protein